MLATAAFNGQRFKEARDWGAKALAVDPAVPDPYAFLGYAEQMAGHPAEAQAAYEKYLQLAPQGHMAGDVQATLKDLVRKKP